MPGTWQKKHLEVEKNRRRRKKTKCAIVEGEKTELEKTHIHTRTLRSELIKEVKDTHACSLIRTLVL